MVEVCMNGMLEGLEHSRNCFVLAFERKKSGSDENDVRSVGLYA